MNMCTFLDIFVYKCSCSFSLLGWPQKYFLGETLLKRWYKLHRVSSMKLFYCVHKWDPVPFTVDDSTVMYCTKCLKLQARWGLRVSS